MAEKSAFSMDLLSASEQKQVKAVKHDVIGLAKAYGAARESASKFAPKMMALFRVLEPKGVGGFIGFVRFLDPSVPSHAKPQDGVAGYLTHRTYYTCDYMRRVVKKSEAAPKDANAKQGRVNPATDQLARLIASVLTIKGINSETVWEAVWQEFGITGVRAQNRLTARVEETKPLIDLHNATVKGEAKVIQMRTPAPAPAESLNKAAAAVGVNRRVRVA